MKLTRPHIPVKVRLEVIARQLQAIGHLDELLIASTSTLNDSARLAYLLNCMFGGEKFHLDHEPALCLRYIIDPDKGLYDPPANDARYLVYRSEEEHRLKTFVRGDGAQLSDAAKRRRKLKKERPARPKPKWPQGRKLRSRPWP